MNTPVDTLLTTVRPTDEDARVARRGSLKLHQVKKHGSMTITVAQDSGEMEIDVPAIALRMLEMILDELAEGRAVALAPLDREVSTQKAADLLNVSRPYLIRLLESGKIPFRKVGSHRRIRLADALKYKASMDAEAERAFSELVSQAQELGMGYE